eukprot:c27938_g1_i1 orf=647-3565(+)
MPAPEGESSVVSTDSKYCMTATEEKVAIQAILKAAESEVKEGDMHYLVSNRWWKQWGAYVGEDTSNCNGAGPTSSYCSKLPDEATPNLRRPSIIDNSDLLISSIREDHPVELVLREMLIENHDYILVPEQVWMALHKWYGGGPALPRKVINTGSVHEDNLTVEVYPLQLCLSVTPNGHPLTVRISKKDTVGELYQRARELFNLGSERFRIWDYFGKTRRFLMSDPKQTLQDAEILMDHDILLEVQVDGHWPGDSTTIQYENGSAENELALVPVEPSRSSFSIAGGPTGSGTFVRSCSPDLGYSHSLGSPFKDLDAGLGISSSIAKAGPLGLTGLQNLGNTCFMNSAIQCLAHTPQLVDFFLQDYNQEINQQNPLGMEGELAIAFGDLLRKLWAETRTPVAPRAFKAKLARFAPPFSGYNQHDSQELLAFLLDGLHEDLNRVKLKPYVESKDADGRPDEEVAHEYWENHKARNDSIIVDICQGQYKSTLVCPVCSKVSVTFDPFMYLSLPLPSTTTRTVTATIFSSDGSSPPMPYTITVPKQSRCKDVIQALSKACNLRNDEKLLLMELYDPRSYRFVDEFVEWLSTIHDNVHLIAYRLPKVLEKTQLLVFVHRRLGEDSLYFQGSRQLKHFGAPLIAPLPDEGLQGGIELVNVFKTLLTPLIKVEQTRILSNHSEEEHQQNGTLEHIDVDLEMLDQEDSAMADRASMFNGIIADSGGYGQMNGNLPQCVQLFQLFLTEEKNMGRDIPIDIDKPLPLAFSSIRMNSKIQITVDWSDKALKKYDVNQLEALPEVYKLGFPAKKARQETVSLYTCLEAFLKEEPLGPEDMWYCPCCKEHRQASKKLDLWRLPEILVVHLKRFSYSRFSKNKLETFVNFPIHDLDLTKYISRKDGSRLQCYELYAISNHYGGMGGGHYTAYAKLIDDNRWYNFDDSHVSPVGEDEIKTAAAYVLFYRKVRVNDDAFSNGGVPAYES